MEVSRLSSGQASVKMPGAQVIDLDSDIEPSIDALEMKRVGISGVNGIDLGVEESGDEDEEEGADWSEVESLYEDTLEEMGDEHLLVAGKSPETRMSMTR